MTRQRPTLRRMTGGAIALLALLLSSTAGAAPFLPSSGQAIIETLPRSSDGGEQELQRLRRALALRPDDLALATGLAERYIARGRTLTDPRYFGYAQAALGPWWQLAAPPTPVRLLRATLLQHTHQFTAALADLEGVLASDPNHAQAWLTRATVQTVLGDYRGANSSCARLARLAEALVVATCQAAIGSATGRTLPSETMLAQVLKQSSQAAPALREWALTLLAEMAARRGDAALAETRFQAALALDPHDSYLQGAYADFLLDQRRPAAVLRLLDGQTRIDALLLRRALALKQAGGPAGALAADTAELGARYEAAMQRGDSVHQREQARYALSLRGEPKLALSLAQRNFSVQKEAADLRIFLEAALSAGDPGAAKPVLDWVATHHSDDQAVLRLVRRLKGA